MCQALNHGIISHHHLLIHNYTTNIYINVFITKSKIKDYMHAFNGVWLSMTKNVSNKLLLYSPFHHFWQNAISNIPSFFFLKHWNNIPSRCHNFEIQYSF